VNTEDPFVNGSAERKLVEDVAEDLPNFDVVATLALVVEAVNSGNGGALMVTTEKEKVVGIIAFVDEEQRHDFQGILTTVYVVAQEEVIRRWRESSKLKQTQEIVILTMYVSTHGDRGY
jgi:hypothetical protein